MEATVRVLSIHHGHDIAGSSYGIAAAFRRHPQAGITVRSAVRRVNWVGYPADVPWEDAAQHWERADVVHLHRSARAFRLMGGPAKPYVLHHHGTNYRRKAELFNEHMEATAHARAVVSTHDLLCFGPDLTWIPQAHDLDWLATFRDHRPGKRLRVAHAPTNRAIKDTAAFLEACAKVNVEPVVIERKAWTDCLRAKGRVDAYYDQMQLGYGSNAIEAWAMGMPVIAGADQPTLARMQRDFGGRHPFLAASVGTLADRLAEMRDDWVRDTWAQRGHEHVREWHDGRVTAERLAGIYRDVAVRRAA